MHRRSWWAVAVAMMVGVVVLGAATSVAVARSSLRGGLVVTVGGLPKSVAPRVRLTGPRGFTRVVVRSQSRFSGLMRGRYVLTIRPARGQGVTWSAGRVKHVSVRVGKGVKRVSVAYTVGVREGTVQVAAGQVLGAVLSPQGGGTLLLKGARGLVRGGYVVVGMTKATPKGFLGHITSITPHGPSAVEVQAGPAGITDVVPEGDFDVTIPAQTKGATSFRASSARADARESSDEPFLMGVNCSDGASLKLSGDANASIGATIHVTHHLLSFHPTIGVRLEADADQSASVTASLSGAASCSLEDTQIGPDIPLGTYPIEVPFTPLTFLASPVLAFSINGEASASAAASTQAGESAHADAGIQWTSNGHISPFASFTHQFSYQAPSFTGKATLSGAVKARITIGIDGTELGPDFALQNGLTLKADPNVNPCWALTDDLSATVGLDLHDLVTIPDYTVYETTFPLAQSGQSCSASVTVSSPGDQTTTKGTAVDLPIKATRTDGGTLTYTASGLPAGLAIDPATGVITGTPTASGINIVTITAADSTGPSGQTSFKWTIPSLTLTNPGSQITPVGSSVSLQITASDDDKNAALSYGAEGLPPGLSIDQTTGLITGTPTTTGTYQVTIFVGDSDGFAAQTTFSWTIMPPPNYGHWVGTVSTSTHYDQESGEVSYSQDTLAATLSTTGMASTKPQPLFEFGSAIDPAGRYTEASWTQDVNLGTYTDSFYPGSPCDTSRSDGPWQPTAPEDDDFSIGVFSANDAVRPASYGVSATQIVAFSETDTTGCPPVSTTFPSTTGIDPSSPETQPLGADPEHLTGSMTSSCDASTQDCGGDPSYTTTITWDVHLVGAADTDGDGVDDYTEFINGTDPLDAKSVPPPGSPGVP
jgi:hypothetical protein